MEERGQNEQKPQGGYGQAPFAPYAPPPKQGWNRKRKAWVIGGSALAFLVLVGAVGNATKKPVPVAATSPRASAVTTSSPAAPATATPRPSGKAAAPAAPTTPSAVALTGFGATQEQWAAHHVADQNNGPEFWDPDPALQLTTTGGVNDAYSGVDFAGTPARALLYDLLMTPRSLSAAEVKVAAELPPDAVVGKPVYDFKGLAGAQCVEVDYTSATLGKILGGAHDDLVYAVFQSAQANTLDLSKIEWVALVSAPQDTDTETNAC
jgi:hypothetical protein